MTLKMLGALGLAVTVGLTSLPAAAQGPIRIGASLSLTGTYAEPGGYQAEGYKLCERDLNTKGGLLGRKVEMVVYDDQSQPATGVRLYEKLITEDKVDAVMGPYSSAISEAVANVTEKYKKVMVAPLAATTSIFKKGRKYAFMVISPAEVYLEGLVDIAAKRKLKTIAIINEDTLFPKASAQGTEELAKKAGLQVVFKESYPKGNQDFSGLLIKLKAANPDVLAAATYFDDAVALARQMKELDVNPKMTGVTVGGDLPKFQELLKQTAEGIYGASQWEGALPYPGRQGVLRHLRQGVQARAELSLGGGLRRLHPVRRGCEEGRHAGGRQGARRPARAEDANDVRRLPGGQGRLPDRSQDGPAPVAGGQARRRVAGRPRERQAAVPALTAGAGAGA